MSKKNLLQGLGIGLSAIGGIVSILVAKMDREEMKAELKEELKAELKDEEES